MYFLATESGQKGFGKDQTLFVLRLSPGLFVMCLCCRLMAICHEAFQDSEKMANRTEKLNWKLDA
jgi:hypothetical protein